MSSFSLSQLYDGDLFRHNPEAAKLREALTIPHPLLCVQYADGIIRDTTAGHVRCHVHTKHRK